LTGAQASSLAFCVVSALGKRGRLRSSQVEPGQYRER